ncbi:MAG TPA: hypothetical protein VMJ93_08040 [Verrucomicrobiae bacterium]|nr:hypothetical protein [Verrucomicrobiae bacterium]
MIKASRLATIFLLAFGALLLPSTSRAQSRPPIVEQMAKAYGLDSYGQIDAVRYTFNLQLASLHLNISRSWTWEPKTGKVTFEGKDKDGKPLKVTYIRSQLNSAPANVKDEIDPKFLNDNYWLIFPFHVYWDTSANVTVKEKQKLPLGKGTATLVSVKYPAEGGGYTPGDTWDLYVGHDNRIEELLFRHGGNVKPSVVIATWSGYKKAGPLLVSTEHRGTADGKPLRLTLSDVAVKLAGSDKWLNAQ